MKTNTNLIRTRRASSGAVKPAGALAVALAMAMAMAVSGCGGGDQPQAPAPAVDLRETSVTASATYRWSGGGSDGISIGAMTSASDGGLWVAGTEGGLYGRPFLRKLEGATQNPCGAQGSRFLTEISDRFERRQGVLSMTEPKDGAFYLAFKGPADAVVARYMEATCSIDTSFGDQGVAVFPVPGLLVPMGMALQRDAADGVLVLVEYVGSFQIKRLTSAGTWDTGFGDQGVTASPASDSFWLGSMATTAQGEILISGSVSIPYAFEPMLMKLDAAGKLVTAFGTGGVQRYPELSRGTGSAGSMVIEANRIVFGVNTAASVTIDDIVTNDSVVAAADLSTGQLLPFFGNGGFLRWDWGYNNSNMVSAWLPNGRGGYTGCGHVIKSFVLGQPAALVDVTGAGQFDATIAYQGRRLINQTTVAQCAALTRMPDGRLAAAINDSSEAVVMLIDQ